ncbi:MAG: hypothetical protein U5R49_13740 [Deltaproteobacteria bacterium]|nr:hypothetical protein [Deltaproteobacteria bacterium]
MRILICDQLFPAMMEVLTELLPREDLRTCNPDQVNAEAPWAEVLIPAMTPITAKIIGLAPDLKLIQQFGVGLEGVDIPAATVSGNPCGQCPRKSGPGSCGMYGRGRGIPDDGLRPPDESHSTGCHKRKMGSTHRGRPD